MGLRRPGESYRAAILRLFNLTVSVVGSYPFPFRLSLRDERCRMRRMVAVRVVRFPSYARADYDSQNMERIGKHLQWWRFGQVYLAIEQSGPNSERGYQSTLVRLSRCPVLGKSSSVS